MVHAHDPMREDAAAFRRLRYGLGLLGLALPFILALSGRVVDGVVQPTISDVFHTTQRDLLVGGLSAIGVFLMVHRGWRRFPGRWVSPDLIVVLAGMAAMGVAFFPNESTVVATTSQKIFGLSRAPVLHYGSALMLYLMMSMTCFLVYAPEADAWERRVYVWSGRVIFASGVMVMVLSGIKNNTQGVLAEIIVAHNLVFWDESIGVWAFSACWLLKAWTDSNRAAPRQWSQADGRSDTLMTWLVGGHEPPHPGAGTSRTERFVKASLAALGRLSQAPNPRIRQSATPAQITAQRRHRRVVDQSVTSHRSRKKGPVRRRA